MARSAPQGAAITTALIVGGLSAPEIAGVMRQSRAGRLGALSVIVDRATGRGELPAGTGPAAFMHAMPAPPYCRLLVTCEPGTERDADLGAAAALAAALAGVFRTPPDSAGWPARASGLRATGEIGGNTDAAGSLTSPGG